MDNSEEQENEILVLKSIYDESQLLLAREGEEPGGTFLAIHSLPIPICLRVPAKQEGKIMQENTERYEVVTVKHLPPITLNFMFPWDYPSTQAPQYKLSCDWLSRIQLSRLCGELDRIWEENKGSVILFEWIRFLQEETFNFLQIKPPLDLTRIVLQVKRSNHVLHKKDEPIDPCLETSSNILDLETDHVLHAAKENCDPRVIQQVTSVSQLFRSLVDYDKQRGQEIFQRSVSQCAICFVEKSGRACMRFTECDHVFCRDCVREYFKVQIQDGNMKGLNCPEPDCETQAYPHQVKELVTAEEYERYDKLLLQNTLETMSDVVYCPRKDCQSPVIKEANCNMGRCPDCGFVFCSVCKLSYHGLSPCRLKSDELQKLQQEYLKADEETKRFLEKRYGKRTIHQALEETFSAEWLEKNAKMCPYCGTQIQKTDGCNKMTCIKCRTYFCWICHTLLSRSNPYGHYSMPGSPCFERLFEGVNIDDDDDDWLDDDDWEF